MKLKDIFSTVLILTMFSSFNMATAQDEVPNDEASVNPWSGVILQPYVGAPNMKKWVYDNNSNYETTEGMIHYGFSMEFRISKRIGVGLDAIYTPLKRTIQSTYYDSSTGGTVISEHVTEITEDKFRIMPKVFIHFNVDDPKWDVYISGGVGLNIINKKTRVIGEKSDEGYTYYEDYNDFPIFDAPFPLAGRFCFGTRYYFSNALGISFETGFGGPSFALGLSLKI